MLYTVSEDDVLFSKDFIIPVCLAMRVGSISTHIDKKACKWHVLIHSNLLLSLYNFNILNLYPSPFPTLAPTYNLHTVSRWFSEAAEQRFISHHDTLLRR